MLFLLYHGSYCEVDEPKIIKGGFHKDFWDAFYCTRIESQAIQFCKRKGKKNKQSFGYVSSYFFLGAFNEDLKIKEFVGVSDEWADFIIHCRNGGTHEYDIVIGPMADDSIWKLLKPYKDGLISRDYIDKMLKFNRLTDQVAFCTEKSLKYIKYEGSVRYE